MPTFNTTGSGYAGTEQSYTIPSTGPYRLIAKGARGGVAVLSAGGFNAAGNGARLETTVTLNSGDVIKIRVGHAGGDHFHDQRGSGGGGATTIYNSTTGALLLCAGGGGGAGQYPATNGETTASLTTTGKPGYLNGNTVNAASTNGNGGQAGQYAGGGGGWNGDGATATTGAPYGYGGTSLRNGNSYGGRGFQDAGGDLTFVDGGYGGGGGGYAGCGGGGGYSGGGGGGWANSGNGGGGGSYINPSGSSNVLVADSTGAGQASIEIANERPYVKDVNPNLTARDPRLAQAFTWTYMDVEGNAQTSYEIRYSLRNANSWTSTGTINSAATSHTFAANTFILGKEYDWQIKVSDSFGPGLWSITSYFMAAVDTWKYTAKTNSSSNTVLFPGGPLLEHTFESTAPGWESNSVFGTFATATVARTTTRAKTGSYSLEVTWPGGTTWANTILGNEMVYQGGMYVMSADVYVPAGSPDVHIDPVFNPVLQPRNTVTAKDQWVNVKQTFMALQDNIYMGVVAQTSSAGTKVFIDNFRVDPMPTPTDPGTYIAEVRTADASGAWSDWSYTPAEFIVSPLSNVYRKVNGVVQVAKNNVRVGGVVKELSTSKLAVPRRIPGLTNWLNANELMAKQGNNTRVAGWTDVVSGQVAIPTANVNNQPLLIHNGVNGQPTVRFDAAQYEGLRMPITNLTTHTTFVVARWTQAGSYNGRIIGGNGDVGYNVLFGWHDAGAAVMYANGWVRLDPNEGKHANWRQFTFTGTGAVSAMYSKGTLLAENGNGVASLGPTLVMSGYTASGTSEMSNCEISEFIMYNRVLTAAERTEIETYLINKYAI